MDCAKCNGCAETGKHAYSAQCCFQYQIRACSTTDVQLHSNTKIFFLLFLQRRKEVEFRHGLRAV